MAATTGMPLQLRYSLALERHMRCQLGKSLPVMAGYLRKG
jgi:hypothetical protein